MIKDLMQKKDCEQVLNNLVVIWFQLQVYAVNINILGICVSTY